MQTPPSKKIGLVEDWDLDRGVDLVGLDDGVDSADSDHTDSASPATDSMDGRTHLATGTPSALDFTAVVADSVSHLEDFTTAKPPPTTNYIASQPRTT